MELYLEMFNAAVGCNCFNVLETMFLVVDGSIERERGRLSGFKGIEDWKIRGNDDWVKSLRVDEVFFGGFDTSI